jgi:hypothetical protein
MTDTIATSTFPLDKLRDAITRVRAEYLEMPGLKLTRAQAARLWALDSDTCEAVLTSLVDARFLVRTANASFVLA